MAKISGLPAAQRVVVSRFGTAASAFSHIENGIVLPVNDTLNELVGSELPQFYAKIVEGARSFVTFPGAIGTPLGAVYYEEPAAKEGVLFVATSDNKIYKVTGGGEITLVRDVGADGYEISRLSGFLTARYLYMVVGDASMSAYIYKYDPMASKAIASVSDYGATVAGSVKVTAIDHGLNTGMTVTISGTTDYDGDHEVTVIDSSNFYITATWTTTKTGSITNLGVSIMSAPGLVAGGRIITGMENRLLVFHAGQTTLPGQFSGIDPTSSTADFTSGVGQEDGGDLAGGLNDVRAAVYFRGLTFAFERRRITVHRIGDPFSNLTTLIRDNNTLEDGYSIDGRGTSSPYGVCVGRGEIFYVDDSSGVYSYSASGTGVNTKIGGKELSAPIHETIIKYDLTNAAIGYHPGEDLLLVSCSSIKGGGNDTIFYYSFQSKCWSKDTTKFVKQFVWHESERQMYGVSSFSSKIVKIFNGTYHDENGAKITMKVRSLYFDGGGRSEEKEYIDSSVIVGVPSLVERFNYALFVNSETVPQRSISVDVSSFSSPGTQALAAGPWGGSLFGGASGEASTDLTFVQYYNDDLIDDHRRVAAEITVTPGAPFAVFTPRIVCEVIDETSDDFL